MGLLTKSCPACGQRVMRGFASACSRCGAQVHGLWKTCPGCKDMQPASNAVCSRCGDRFPPAGPAIATEVWRRTFERETRRLPDGREVEGDGRPREIARRFLLDPAAPPQGLLIEPGVQAHVLQHDVVVMSLDPGFWSQERLVTTLTGSRAVAPGGSPPAAGLSTVGVVLVEAGDFVVDFSVPNLVTSDAQQLQIEVRLILRLADVGPFCENALKGQDDFTYGQLRQVLFPELRNVLGDFLRGRTADGLLQSAGSTKSELEASVKAQLAATLGRLGVDVVQARAIDFRGPWIDVQSELGQVALAERRALVWERLQNVDASRKLAGAKTQAELQQALRDLEQDSAKREVLREEEIAELAATFAEQREDRQGARARVADRASREHKVEMHRLEALGCAQTEQRLAEIAQTTRRLKVETELEEQRLREQQRLELEAKAFGAQMQQTEQAASVDDRIRAMKIERGASARERKDAIDLARKEKEQLLALDAEKARAELEAERERQQLEAMKDWSEDKILAWFSRNSDGAARVLAERFRAGAEVAARDRTVLESTLERVLRVVERQPGPAPAATFLAPGGHATILGGVTTATRACSACRTTIPADAAFCPRCAAPTGA